MELIFKSVLVGYFVLFLGLALLYRSYFVFKKTGINPLKQSPEDGTLKILAIVLKIHLLLVAGLIADYVIGTDVLTSNRFEWLSTTVGGGVGSLLLITCLLVIITAQTQMSSSWRIEIDSKNQAKLITKGLFNYSRNPIFIALRLSYFAMFLIVPCPYSLMTFIIADICFQLQAQKEEQYLQQAYGENYIAYCSLVRRWL